MRQSIIRLVETLAGRIVRLSAGGQNPVAIPMPEGMDFEAFERVPDRLWQDDPAEAARQMREKNRLLFEFNSKRAIFAGASSYRWRYGDDDCSACRERDGRLFSYASPPVHGDASLCTTCPGGYCQCWAEPLISG